MRFNHIAFKTALVLTSAALAATQPAGDSPLSAPPNGPRHEDPTWHALVGATVHVAPGQSLDGATVVIRAGRITDILVPRAGGQAPAPPRGARVWDYTGLHLYPGLIDPAVDVDAPTPDPDAPGTHWNAKVTPQRSALDGDGIDDKAATALRSMGFVAARISPKGGVFRGTSAVVSLAKAPGDSSEQKPPVYRRRVDHVLAFERAARGSGGTDPNAGYPSSTMGAIALIRQTFLDADWQIAAREAGATIARNAIDALDRDHPLVFDVSNELDALRAIKIAREFDRPVVVLGSGSEYKRLDAIRDAHVPFIVPLRFPKKPQIDSIGAADAVSLGDMMAWEQAPTNPRRLDDAGVVVSLTTGKLTKGQKFRDNLRTAIKNGLGEDRALAMLTTNPAKLLGVDDSLGTIETGKIASILVADAPIFDKKTKIRDLWIDGRRHEINPPPPIDVAGTWDFTFGADPAHDGTLIITQDDAGKVSIKSEKTDDRPSIKARDIKLADNRLSYLVDVPDPDSDANEVVIASAIVEGDSMLGQVMTPDGRIMAWTGTRRPPEDDAKHEDEPDNEPPAEASDPDDENAPNDEDAEPPDVPDLPGYPFGPYALKHPPEQPHSVLISGATIWTSGPAGVIENGQMIITDGRITFVGPAVPMSIERPDIEIDATGKHITPGLIDAHSHTGISGGVNEGTQAITAEVRIADVTNPDDIAWYRELAGGLTVANSLHGSANPIGGQTQVNKLRWGVPRPDQMHFQGALPGIKFALGENVKQSNWGDRATTRYPQTRMGVETIIRDAFTAAREYARRQESYHSSSGSSGGAGSGAGVPPASPSRLSLPPRRDLELEALAEVLAGERFIHCHSYRQDEILMLCRVAGDFGFRIGAFQHVLEGYKVADAIKEHAIGASTFSDWWAYKVEVQDAIPYNGAIMHDVGVVVSFNSDSSELARRMNTEAAKAVRYGGLDPAEALKFVTINPAIQLGIDDRVGSLEYGKDADFAIWSGDPLSTTTRCEATWIDGREYFSIEQDARLREHIASERQRLIQKLLKKDQPKKSKKNDAKEKQVEEDEPDSPTPEQH